MRGRVIMITGASAGIGHATALYLAQEGASVVLIARRAERLDALAEQIKYEGHGRALVLVGDVADASFVAQAVAKTLATFGRVDVLLNNAGIGHHSSLMTISEHDMQAIWQTNVMGIHLWSQAVAAEMITQPLQNGRRGQIINVSSIVHARPLTYAAVYTASKAAVSHLTRGWRMTLRPYQIVVTAVYPGVTQTEFNQVRLGEVGESSFSRLAVSPERVAFKIGRGIRQSQQEIYVTPIDWLFTHGNRLFPRVLDRVFG